MYLSQFNSKFTVFCLGGADAGGWEEYFDYIFPEDEGAKPNLKLLAMAKMWKKQKETVPEEKEDSENEEERIPISEEIPEDADDADDEDMRNESSGSEESSDEQGDDENDEPKAKRKKE